MFNYNSRQYVFRRSNGDLWNFFCDSRQNICCSRLTRQEVWSNSSILAKNTYPSFYADLDRDNAFHLLYQDNDGNIHYARLDEQSAKSVTVLNSKLPSVYNKHLFLAPFQNSIHFFYVLQHENSFLLSYQVLADNKISSPRVVDYVSGSSLPCALAYDKTQNIYAFYQSYDGKYLQLGYKKRSAELKSWSEFTPVTKYAGHCEYPHVLIGEDGIIHLCYQRRAPKYFELVYQQKLPDKNLWSAEEVIHSSVHSFENASILKENGNIVVYWVRDEVIYFSSTTPPGNNWTKAGRHGFTAGRQLQCIGFKSGDPFPPVLYPGSVSNGFRLAFGNPGTLEEVARLFGLAEEAGKASGSDASRNGMDRGAPGASGDKPQSPGNREYSSNRYGSGGYYGSGSSDGFSRSGSSKGSSTEGGDIRNLVLDAFRQLQNRMDEAKEGSSTAKEELARLTNAYDRLAREVGKYTIRLELLESQLGQTKRMNSKLDEVSNEIKALKESRRMEGIPAPVPVRATAQQAWDAFADRPETADDQLRSADNQSLPSQHPECSNETRESQNTHTESPNRPSPKSLDPEKLKEWEEWEEPREWQEG